MQTLQEMLKDACEEVGDDSIVSFRNDYSGRGMFGRRCVGVDGNESECHLIIGAVIKKMAGSLVAVARESVDPEFSATDMDLADTEHDFDSHVDTLLDYCQDSMGTGIIVYWPELNPIEG